MSPNPTASVLNIGFSNNQADGQTLIELYDAAGEKVRDVYNGFLAKEKTKNMEVDLSSLKAGNYFILIESNGSGL
ncbi:hypothetical protein FNO01nite_04960 [Flavobacterium noncentrifugens]|uniref:T9SS type A sorting domain-containing protein n=1 Tax=Flavobacterium noncentrifugens TaxID=1128970 RepID=UPI00118EEC72|nr:T9SS type A sorting domain-containing protein [Flavobacterium noncentrifugens]GEP49824.1 hypothetical protein FNO01nite_04960 [Flavobacterium noncentrifugens]